MVLGNVGTRDDVPALAGAFADDEPLVRAHVARALGRIGPPDALAARRAEGALLVSDEASAAFPRPPAEPQTRSGRLGNEGAPRG
jgi:HEAT repeat protein